MKIKKYLLILSTVVMAAWFLCSCDSAVRTEEKIINVKRAIELATPGKLTYTADLTSLDISWNMVENADKYEVYMSESEVFGEEPTTTQFSNTYKAENLTAGKTYYFKVRAVASHYNNVKDMTYYSGFSTILKATTENYPVKPVVTAEITDVDSVKLSWEKINDCYSYKVYQGEDASSDNAKCISLYQTSCTYTAEGLTLGKTYYFWVESNVDFEYYKSDAVMVEMKLPAPANFAAVRKTSSSVELNWNSVDTADGYNVAYYIDDETDDVVQISVAENKATVTDLEVGVYTFKVCAYKGDKVGAETDGVEVSTFLPAVTIKGVTPAGCVKSSAYSSYYDVTFEVEWEKLGMDEAGYAVYYSSSETYFSSADKIYAGKDVTSARVTVKEIYNNYTCYFKVAAYDSNNKEGACSEIKSMKFQLATAPENLFGEMETDTSIKLSWDTVEGADCYNVYDSANKLLATVKDTDFVVTGLQYMTEYTFKVETVNSYGIISEKKAETKAVTFPSVQNVKVKAVKENNSINVTVTWDNLTEDDVTYTVYLDRLYSYADEYYNCDYESNATSGCTIEYSSYSDYSYRVRVIAEKESDSITSESKPVYITFPEIPENVEYTDVSDKKVNLTWDSAENAVSYNIYRGTSSSGTTKTLVGTTTDCEYTVENLIASSSYYFWVEAVNADGNSAMSSYVYCKTLMEAPANVTVAATANYGELKVTYNSVSGATYYYIYVNTENVIPNKENQTVYNDTSCTLTGLENGTEYYVWVRCKNSSGTFGGYSESVSAVTKGFGTPANVSVATTNNPGELSISFDAVTDADSYYVYVNTKNTRPTTQKTSLTTNSGKITGLDCGTEYYVWVKAYDKESGLYSAYSEAVTATTKTFTAPANVSVAATNNPGELSITLDKHEDADYYYVYVNEDDVRPVTYKTCLTTNSGVVTGLEYNKEYYVWVRAYNSTSDAYSAYSESATATTKSLGVTQNVTVKATTNLCQLSVSFDSVAGADEYYVYVSETTTKPMSYTKLTTNSGNVSVGKNNTEYYVWVKAHNSTFNVNGAYSEVATGTTRVFTVPSFYADEPGMFGTSGSIDLKSISYLSCTDKLIVEFSLTSDFATIEKTSTISPTSSTTIYGLKSDTYYYVRMKAYDAETDTYSDYSAVSGDYTE